MLQGVRLHFMSFPKASKNFQNTDCLVQLCASFCEKILAFEEPLEKIFSWICKRHAEVLGNQQGGFSKKDTTGILS